MQHPAVAKRILETIDWHTLLKGARDSHTHFLELAANLHVSPNELLRTTASRVSERLHT